MSKLRPTIFISYSHQDESWKDRLVAHLRVLEFEGALEVWDDRRIAAGDDWRPEIERAIELATVAILIVSKDFLTSKFIREHELTRILSRRASQSLRVIPIIAEPCAWEAVSSLRGIQARPKDGRPLSAGGEHEIDSALTSLALEIRNELVRSTSLTNSAVDLPPASLVEQTPKESRLGRFLSSISLLVWLSVPSVVLGATALAATNWRLETHVSVDVITRRLSFDIRGSEPQDLLNLSPTFSELTLERCGEVSFTAAELKPVDPNDQASGQYSSRPFTGPLRLICDDPGSKITIAGAAKTPSLVGVLDRIRVEPNATVVIDIQGEATPVLTLDVTTNQFLSIPVHADLRVDTELVRTEPDLDLAAWDAAFVARLPDADRMIRVQSSERGAVLIVTPTPDSSRDLMNERLPVKNLQFVDEQIGGKIKSPFLKDVKLRYPDHPSAPTLVIPRENFLLLSRTNDMDIRRVRLDNDDIALALTVDGNISEAEFVEADPGSPVGKNKGRLFDPRLSMFDTIRYGPRWNLIYAVVLWAMATTWVGYERWRKTAE